MAFADLRSEERTGLVVALALHAALVAALVWGPKPPQPLPLPERMTVTLSDDVALTSTSPEPAAQPAPDEAPVLGERHAPAPVPLPEPAPVVRPEPVAKPILAPKPVQKIAPPPPQPRPAPRAPQRPAPVAKPAVKAPAPRTVATPLPRRPAQPAGGSRIGTDFLKGVSGAKAPGTATSPPAATIGPEVRASFAQSVLRQVKPNWQGRVPQGVNTDRLVTIISIELNRDGTLARAPTVVRQEGIDEENRAQAQRHAEEAVRAVQLSAPFHLPADQYEGWKRLPPLRFRKTI